MVTWKGEEMTELIYKLRKLQPKYATVTIDIKSVITNEFKLRKNIALFLIRIACWIVGAGVKVNDTPTDEGTYIIPRGC